MYKKILNPETGRKVNINTKKGILILKKYLSIYGGADIKPIEKVDHQNPPITEQKDTESLAQKKLEDMSKKELHVEARKRGVSEEPPGAGISRDTSASYTSNLSVEELLAITKQKELDWKLEGTPMWHPKDQYSPDKVTKDQDLKIRTLGNKFDTVITNWKKPYLGELMLWCRDSGTNTESYLLKFLEDIFGIISIDSIDIRIDNLDNILTIIQNSRNQMRNGSISRLDKRKYPVRPESSTLENYLISNIETDLLDRKIIDFERKANETIDYHSPTGPSYFTDINMPEIEEWKTMINEIMSTFLGSLKDNEKIVKLDLYRLYKKNDNPPRARDLYDPPGHYIFNLTLEITQIKLKNYLMVYGRVIDIKVPTPAEAILKIDGLDLLDFYRRSNIFPNLGDEWEIFGVNLIKLFKKGFVLIPSGRIGLSNIIKIFHQGIDKSNKHFFRSGPQLLYNTDSNKRNNNEIGQLYFQCRFNNEIKKDYDKIYTNSNLTGTEIQNVIDNKDNVSSWANDQDKYHIVYNKEYETIALYEFQKYMITQLHGFMHQTSSERMSGKYVFSLSPLQFLDFTEIDESLKDTIKWNEFINFFLNGRAPLVLYIGDLDTYGNQKTGSHLINYWNKLPEIIAQTSNNLSYNIRLSKFIFYGSADTMSKDILRDKYRIPEIKDSTKFESLTKYKMHSQVQSDYDKLCFDGKPRDDISSNVKNCVQKKYMFDIDDLCKPTLNIQNHNIQQEHYDEGVDYPRSKLSDYKSGHLKNLANSNTVYFGYKFEDDNPYRLTCNENPNQ